MSWRTDLGGVDEVMDIAAVDSFYRKHASDLMRLAVVLVGPDDAEDVFSEAVLKVIQSKRWPSLTEEEQPRYAYRAVVNYARSWGRSAGRRVKREDLYARRSRTSVEHGVPSDVLAAIAGLSIRQRAVVFLTYWNDFDTAMVASTLGISEGSVYQHLNRARTSLRRSVHV